MTDWNHCRGHLFLSKDITKMSDEEHCRLLMNILSIPDIGCSLRREHITPNDDTSIKDFGLKSSWVQITKLYIKHKKTIAKNFQ
jgi:hypothetical protein